MLPTHALAGPKSLLFTSLSRSFSVSHTHVYRKTAASPGTRRRGEFRRAGTAPSQTLGSRAAHHRLSRVRYLVCVCVCVSVKKNCRGLRGPIFAKGRSLRQPPLVKGGQPRHWQGRDVTSHIIFLQAAATSPANFCVFPFLSLLASFFFFSIFSKPPSQGYIPPARTIPLR